MLSSISVSRPEVMTRLSVLYSAQELTDLTIDCPNGRVLAHKLILSSVSHYFRHYLYEKSTKTENNSLIIFADISVEDMKAIIDCIYFGKQLISKNRIQNILKIAERLEIDLITDTNNGNKSERKVHKKRADTTSSSSTTTNTSNAPLLVHQNSAVSALRPVRPAVHSKPLKPIHDSSHMFEDIQHIPDIEQRVVVNEAENDISFDDKQIEFGIKHIKHKFNNRFVSLLLNLFLCSPVFQPNVHSI